MGQAMEELHMKRTIYMALLGGLLMASACGSSDEGDVMARADYDDVAQGMGTVVANGNAGGGDTASLSDSVELALGGMPLGFHLDASGSINGSRAGLQYDYTLTCEDAAGTSLEACGSTTDSATVSIDWSGELSLPNFIASVDRSGEWTIDGLQGDTAELNGSSDFTYSAELHSVFRDEVRTWDLDYSADYDAVLITTDDHVAVGGAIHYAIDAKRTVSSNHDLDAHFVLEGDLTFNGDGSANLVLDGTQTYRIDLQTGACTRL
jgi:hypothetical protein